MIMSFVGGHVISTEDPLAVGDWEWDYFPSIGQR